jgi:tetratricopeptide (TPR) repeat protein
LKTKANSLFSKQEYDEAIVQYTEVLSTLPPRSKETKEEEEGSSKDEETNTSSVADGDETHDSELMEKTRLLRSVVFANLAACHMKLQNYKEAVVACNESLLDDPLYLKAFNRRAQANEELGTWSSLTSSLEGE